MKKSVIKQFFEKKEVTEVTGLLGFFNYFTVFLKNSFMFFKLETCSLFEMFYRTELRKETVTAIKSKGKRQMLCY